MFKHPNQPVRRRSAKPVTQAIARQQSAENRLRIFDKACFIFFSVLILLVIAHELTGMLPGPQHMAQASAPLTPQSAPTQKN
jgi:hypothetical protein